jgi:TRAP-type transport system small permease protein
MKFRAKPGRLVLGALYVIGAVVLLFMMALVSGNSLGRVFFNTPIKMTIEGAGLLGALLVSIAIVLAERKRSNIYVGVLFDRFSERTKAIVESFTLLLCLIAGVFFCWAAFDAAFDSLSMNERTIASRIPMVPLRFTWATGILVLCIYLAWHLVEDIIKVIKK